MQLEVRYTTLLKGHLAAGDLTSAWSIIDQMLEAGAVPDLRTLNTFLRGCVKLGALKDAEVRPMEPTEKSVFIFKKIYYMIYIVCFWNFAM